MLVIVYTNNKYEIYLIMYVLFLTINFLVEIIGYKHVGIIEQMGSSGPIHFSWKGVKKKCNCNDINKIHYICIYNK